MALFVVGGLVFSYGLGHAPPARVCTQHAVSVPVGVAAAFTGHVEPDAAALPLHGSHSPVHVLLAAPPMKVPAPASMDACLCLAVLFTLMLLAVAAAGRRALLRLPARIGWALAPPAGAAAVPASAPVLQVLRL